MEKKRNILMQKYEIGRLLGQGTFAKVHHARDLKSGRNVAIKIIDKEQIFKVGLIDQIKREISVMGLIKHPNVIQLHEVLASKSRIYFAMEYVRGGELFNKIAKGRLKEDAARRYFQQLIAAVDYCHSRGVYHRDLKPENLLLDQSGNLKVSDFGLSALVDSKWQDGLLHTTCGTPAYVAPEVIKNRGYDGEKADIWSCGVILYVLMAGYLPFQDPNLMEMYKKIGRGDFKCPHWFPSEVKRLLSRILDPRASSRITVAKIMENPWFKKGFRRIESLNSMNEYQNGFPGNLRMSPSSIFENVDSDTESSSSSSSKKDKPEVTKSSKPTSLNAFDLISLSPGFDLSGLFEDEHHNSKQNESWFTTQQPPSMVVSKLEELATTQSFEIMQNEGGIVKMQGNKAGRKGQLAIDAEIFELAPSLHMVEVKKTSGDTIEYQKFCDQGLRPTLKDVVWSWQGSASYLKDQPIQEEEEGCVPN